MNLVWMLRPLNPPPPPFYKGGASPFALVEMGALFAPLKKGVTLKAWGDFL
jgi:hypothetical protein